MSITVNYLVLADKFESLQLVFFQFGQSFVGNESEFF